MNYANYADTFWLCFAGFAILTEYTNSPWAIRNHPKHVASSKKLQAIEPVCD